MTGLLARETKTKASKEASPSPSLAMYARAITSIRKGDKIVSNREMLREVTRKEEISVTKKIAVIIAVILNEKETQSKVKPCMNLSCLTKRKHLLRKSAEDLAMVTGIIEIVVTQETETIETDRETRSSKVNTAIAVNGVTTGATMEKRADAIERRGLKRTT